MEAALGLMRRMPPRHSETTLSALLSLLPGHSSDLLSQVDLPLQVSSDVVSGQKFILCEYNRDADSYRSPWSNKYHPPLEDAPYPSSKLRQLEIEANDIFTVYCDQYYEGGISSVYMWEDDNEGFVACFLVKKDGSKTGQGRRGYLEEGTWDAIHVIEVGPDEEVTRYCLTSTVMLSLTTDDVSSGTFSLSGSIRRQMNMNLPVADGHLSNMGKMIEELEGKLRNSLDQVYFGKTREMVCTLRPSNEDYYDLYKLYKNCGPDTKKGEQYGAPFKEEWADEEYTSKPVHSITAIERPNDATPDDNGQPPLNDIQEFMRQFADEPTLPSHKLILTIYCLSLLVKLHEALEVTSVADPFYQLPQIYEEEFLEIDDLNSYILTSNVEKPVENGQQFKELNGLGTVPFSYAENMINQTSYQLEPQSNISLVDRQLQPQLNIFGDSMLDQVDYQLPFQSFGNKLEQPLQNQTNGTIWTHDQSGNVFTPSGSNHGNDSPFQVQALTGFHTILLLALHHILPTKTCQRRVNQTMDSMSLISVSVLFVSTLMVLMMPASGSSSSSRGSIRCSFPAIYNFGDSNSDTGACNAAVFEIPPPYGETFFKQPSGRASDGRLVIDFIAEKLGVPYLNAYLDSIGTSFRHGANFAAGGSCIQPKCGYGPFNLATQVSQFIHFKARATALYNQLRLNRKIPAHKIDLPRPDDFSQAIYTLDIGHNDLAYGYLQHRPEAKIRASVPRMLNLFSQAVHLLYGEGARVFWIHNMDPIGCLPFSVMIYQPKAHDLDRYGCVIPQNEMAKDFNRQLKDKVFQLRTQLPSAAFTYVDVYSVKYALITDAEQQGFVDPLTFCCGSYGSHGHHVDCGKKVNGTVYGSSCGHPSRYISWDGIHFTEAANSWVANRILNGSFSDPPVSIDKACYRS
ncbi:hypothetical protein V6N13_120782 [Hibiscus sabdariffa]